MKIIKNFTIPGLIIVLYIIIFGRWMTPGVLSGGDWPFLYPKAVSELVLFSTWDTVFNNGMGQSSLPKIWFDSYALTIVKLANVLSWPVFERVVWFFPYLIVSFFGAYILSKKFVDGRNFNLLSGVIYSLNTYILLIVSGGQAGVFTAYAFLPFVFWTYFNLTERFVLRRSLIFSLSLALLILLDLRVGYMFLIAECMLAVLHILFYPSKAFIKILYMLLIPGTVVLLFHFFWVFPIILMGRNPASQLGDIYTSSTSLSFFSFAKMENAIALLHPNWPENLFGKVSFLRAEFLLIPLFAFSSLLFIKSEEKLKRISLLSFVTLSVVGIFLAKGTNDPFGYIYELLFNKIPGFVMFRDPTKWYMLTAVSFCILIPYSLEQISERISVRFKTKDAAVIVCLVFLFFWTYAIRDSFNGVVKGTLRPREISKDYQSLAKLVESDGKFSRTMWIPVYPTFAYVSNTHPAVPAIEFLSAKSLPDFLKKLKNPGSEKILQDAGIKYVIVPEDTDGKIFVTDRKYDNSVYKKTLQEVDKVNYLSRVKGYGGIGVYKVESPRGHFWSPSSTLRLTYKYISLTRYEVSVTNAKKGDKIVFTESYDRFWKTKGKGYEVSSSKYQVSKNQILNSFVLPRDGSYTIDVYYQPQQWLNMGMIVSGLSLSVILLIFFKFLKR